MKAILRRLPLMRELLALRDAAVSLDRRLANLQVQRPRPSSRNCWRPTAIGTPAGSTTSRPRCSSRAARTASSPRSSAGSADGSSFVEIGVGDGLENNTTYLLDPRLAGSAGSMAIAAASPMRADTFAPLEDGRPGHRETVVTAANVAALLDELGLPAEFDLLSVDVDRNTWYIWEALRGRRPRVVVVEYNATCPPSDEWVVAYEPAKRWNSSNYFGASLKSYELLGRELAMRSSAAAGRDQCVFRSQRPGDGPIRRRTPRKSLRAAALLARAGASGPQAVLHRLMAAPSTARPS